MNSSKNKETIVAQATPVGYGGIGILRTSGSKAKKVAKMILGRLPKPRYVSYLPFKDVNKNLLDQGIALWLPGPNSFTGEDILELHGHSNPIILDLLLKNILTVPGVRIANPGEFSERAFLNGKLDLTQAEAIVDLVNACSEQAARSAVNSLQGVFSAHINRISKNLTELRTNLELSIDFPDEEKMSSFLEEKIEDQLNNIITYLNTIKIRAQQSSSLRKRGKIVITGRPNAGKSSLMNSLAEKEVSIVTNIAGTTRDIIREYINIDGVPIQIVDTAGLRNSSEEIECIGINKALQEIKQADHILFVIDSSISTEIDLSKIWPECINYLPTNLPVTLVFNKIDISKGKLKVKDINNRGSFPMPIIYVSTFTGEGINILINHLKHITASLNKKISTEDCFLARQRHLQELEIVTNHLKECKLQLVKKGVTENSELLAEELRLAQQSLSKITGRFTSDDLLNEIFSKFCIGK